MISMALSTRLEYEILDAGCDFIFNIQAARTPQQTVREELLSFNPALSPNVYTDPVTQSRFVSVHVPNGKFCVDYKAVVELAHVEASPDDLYEFIPQSMPGHVLPYLYPSRYCQSDRLLAFASQQFGSLPMGYRRVQAICDWVKAHVRFQSNSSNSNTSAIDTLVDRVGVCRDFAHLMIALCRAINLPTRMASGVDYGADPQLGPTDFHAYVEVYLADKTGAGRWYLFDPSGTAIPMGFLRLCTGRDAADIAFATIFGRVNTFAPLIKLDPVPNRDGSLVEPHHVDYALSTAGMLMGMN